MAINIYRVANHLEEHGWKLISDSYKNLQTELEMECPKGHRQFQSYEQWRKHMQCDQCMGGQIEKNELPQKASNTRRLLALDAATNTTGFAVYDNDKLVYYGTFTTQPALETDARINEVKHWLLNILNTWEIDFIGIENIQLQNYGGNGRFQVEMYRTLANLQGVLINIIFEAGIDYDLAYSTEWRKYCNISTDKGRENKKKAAQEKVQLWYNIHCTQDEADAICLGKYFLHTLKPVSNWGDPLPW